MEAIRCDRCEGVLGKEQKDHGRSVPNSVSSLHVHLTEGRYAQHMCLGKDKYPKRKVGKSVEHTFHREGIQTNSKRGKRCSVY